MTFIQRLLPRYRDWELADDFGNVEDFNQHAVLYTKFPWLREKVGYLIHPTAPPERWRPARDVSPGADGMPSEIQTELIVRQLTEAGHDVYVVDLTAPDIRQLGVSVVRVLVPDLQHLAGIHPYRMLGSKRNRQRNRHELLPDDPSTLPNGLRLISICRPLRWCR